MVDVFFSKWPGLVPEGVEMDFHGRIFMREIGN